MLTRRDSKDKGRVKKGTHIRDREHYGEGLEIEGESSSGEGGGANIATL